MKKVIVLCLIAAGLSFVNKDAYVLYESSGKKADYAQLLKDASKADVILFGELHDNPIVHWLQKELTSDLYETKKDQLTLSMEMFEADDQVILDEYLQGRITDKTFKDESKEWVNYVTDYKPLIEFAKKNRLKVIAANIPRRYASMVYHGGDAVLDSISPDAKKWIAPLPIRYDPELKCYKDIFESSGGHNGQNLPKSQAYKDATMAYFISKSCEKGKTILHYNGTYHSNFHQGIEWYLKQLKPSLNVFVISSVEQHSTDSLESKNKKSGDYIICTPVSMTKTH